MSFYGIFSYFAGWCLERSTRVSCLAFKAHNGHFQTLQALLSDDSGG